MKLNNVIFPVGSVKTVIKTRMIGDVHRDAEGFDRLRWLRFLRIQKENPKDFWAHFGDHLDSDSATTGAKRDNIYSKRPDDRLRDDAHFLNYLDREIIPELEPIAKQCVGMWTGNHERWLYFTRNVEDGGKLLTREKLKQKDPQTHEPVVPLDLVLKINSTQYICARLGIPYMGDGEGIIKMTGKCSGHVAEFNIHGRHSAGCSTTLAGDFNNLTRHVADNRCEVFVGGHTHQHYFMPLPPRAEYNCFGGKMHVREVPRCAIRCGTFLQAPEYAGRRDYRKIKPAWVTLETYFYRGSRTNRNLEIVGYEGRSSEFELSEI